MHEEDVDVEALQAQIDLSNSVVYDLVSSWMKHAPSKGTATAASSSIARELEEYAKRPPRLGLGASVSKTSIATTREVTKLKGKLVETKRPRDESRDTALTSTVEGIQEEMEDGESRSAAISAKKIRVNGHEGGLALGLTKKNQDKAVPMHGHPVVNVEMELDIWKEDGVGRKGGMKPHPEKISSHGGTSFSTPSRKNPFVTPRESPTMPSAIHLVPPPPVPQTATSDKRITPKREKKHEKLAQESQVKVGVEVEEEEEEEEWNGFSTDVQVSLDLIDTPDNKSAFSQEAISDTQTTPKSEAPKSSASSFVPNVTFLGRPTTSLPQNKHSNLPVGQPSQILNPDGPLSHVRAEGIEVRVANDSSKKRHRRRGKRKRSHGERWGQRE